MWLIILDKATTNNSFIQQNLTKCLLWADHFTGDEAEDQKLPPSFLDGYVWH